jgi:hypothetical protein
MQPELAGPSQLFTSMTRPLHVAQLRGVEAAAPGVGQRFHRHEGRSYAANRRA